MTQQTLQKNDQLLYKAIHLQNYFVQKDDHRRAEKAKLLAKKVFDNEMIVAFCGHFSAGKSTFVNYVVGEELLPSSPIPTSANIVKIKNDTKGYARIFQYNRPSIQMDAPFDINAIKKYCCNGADVETVEIAFPLSVLPEGVTVMDTPGVDSTDDAHRLSTESALHLADVVFYVMDYNHVQSELNFMFTKQLMDHGVPLYLIINQIDKHREEELSFHYFRQSVEQAFATWGVKPRGIYFTSLKDINHTYNELEHVKTLIHSMMEKREEQVLYSTQQALKQLVHEHLDWLKEQQSEERNHCVQIIGHCSKEKAYEEEQRWFHLLSYENVFIEQMEKNCLDELERLIQNAFLMPFETRELARQYIESMQDHFSVGFLFKRKKTEEERARRQDAFYQQLVDNVERHMNWHLKQLASSWVQKMDLHDVALEQQAQQVSVSFTPQLLEQALKRGAKLSGDYVLVYTEDVANTLKKLAYQTCRTFLEHLIQRVEEVRLDKRERLKQSWNEAKKRVQAYERIEALDEELALSKNRLLKLLFEDVEQPEQLIEWIQTWENEFFQKIDGLDKQLDQHQEQNKEDEPISEKEQNVASEVYHSNDMVQKLREAAHRLQSVPGFDRTVQQLQDKATRMESRTYTIALFGAFSAGKSSFANALLGERVLPVSPNPTTAAINRIVPPTNDHPHGTAVITFKTKEAMLEDVQRAFAAFDIRVNDLQDAVVKWEALQHQTDGQEGAQVHQSFLQAFVKGCKEHYPYIGNSKKVNREEFEQYVSREERSCFVESIDFYCHSPYAEKGITLVDTPGADSINARHTGVAFEYIKNADAIFYVTYYNHAFSKADREFLIQLGRVKDSFELDKMFFIVNAIDLAQSEDEQQAVIRYIREQLQSYGIRFPRIFGVSSLFALKEKQGEPIEFDSGIRTFESSFQNFISNELMEITMKAAQAEYEKAINLLKKFIASHLADEETKKQAREQVENNRHTMTNLLRTTDLNMAWKSVEQEIEELVFYIKQRVFFRINDFFKEAFHPSILHSQVKDVKGALRQALNQFIGAIGYDLAQEMRATSLRAEKFMEKTIANKRQGLVNQLKEFNDDLFFSEIELLSWDTPTFESAFENVSEKSFNEALSLYKNPKSFFEKNEKQKMVEELTKVLEPLTKEYLHLQKKRLLDWYKPLFNEKFEQMINQLEVEVHDQMNVVLKALEMTIDVSALQKLWKELSD
jgi:predicted GTPase